MKTKVEFDPDDYRFTHYTKPKLSIIFGTIVFGATIVHLISQVKNDVALPDVFWSELIIAVIMLIVCVFVYGFCMIFPLGIKINRESKVNVTKIKTGTIDEIKQLKNNYGPQYRPGLTKSAWYYGAKPYKPGKILTNESTFRLSDYSAINDAYGQYRGAYLFIDDEKYLVMSSTWFKEGDYVWIKYYPESKIVLEMDYANEGRETISEIDSL